MTLWDRGNKFKAVRTEVDGIKFPSKREAHRWLELRLLERAGVISNLKRQVKYPLIVNGMKVCDYIADFTYSENGETITEDCKGARPYWYLLKKKLMLACHGIKIKET